MKLKRLFLSLTPKEKDEVCASIVEAGLCAATGSIAFRDFLKNRMYQHSGIAREYIKLFRRLDSEQQELFYTAMCDYTDKLKGELVSSEPILNV